MTRIRVLAAIAATATSVFVALTVIVTSSRSLAFDSRAFEAANDLREPWLDHAARAITTLGLLAVVGPAVVLGAAILVGRGHRARAIALVIAAAVAWAAVWIVKASVDRPRPPAPLVHTTGQSFPSSHAANSVGWLALAIALAPLIPTRGGRAAVIAVGALAAVLVGLTRIYLRAHYASDVLAGEALAVAVYVFAAIGVTAHAARRGGAGM